MTTRISLLVRRAARVLVATLLAASVTSGVGVVHAEPSPEAKATAKQLAEEAQDRIGAGDHAGALVLLRRADDAFHAPTIGLLIGRSLVALGRLAEAAEQLEIVATEELPDDAPDAWKNAVKLAADERAALDDDIGKLVLQVEPAVAGATVRIGERAPRPARGEHVVDAARPIELRLEAPGYRVIRQQILVAAGEETVVALTLEPIPDVVPVEPPSEEPPPPPPARSLLHTPWPTVIAGSATAVTFAIGAGLGASAFGDAGEIEDRCGDASCSAASAAERRELRALQESGGGTADASTAFFIVSAACAAATTAFVVLWQTGPGDAADTSATVRGGAGWASIDGTF